MVHNPGDGIAWFRGEVARNVRWAGNPDKAMERDPATGDLSSRRSFAIWSDVLRGHSAPWTSVDLQLVHELQRAVTNALLRHAEAQLARLSHYDALTGLLNRRFLEEKLRGDAPDAAASLIFLDLDRFKTVNDSLGHAVGDEFLVQVARRLEESAPPGLCIARLGGDEFVAFGGSLPVDQAEQVATGLLRALGAPFLLAGRPFRAMASLGIAAVGPDGRDDLLRSADAAMYAAKRQGANQVVRFEGRLHEAVLRRMEIEQDLFQALDRNEFELHFQPLVGLAEGRLIGLEALLRWRNPRRGDVPPSDFIPLAEETALMPPIGAWVLGEALRRLAEWRRSDPGLYVSVNVSGQQIAQADLACTVADALAAAGLPPDALLLEATETVLMQDTVVSRLEEVRATGVRIAIDDFGTGYSSLAYLERLPVDVLKIDRSLLARVGEDRRRTEFFEAVVRLGETLGLEVIVEGVEEERQWRHLRTLCCHGAQGFWLSRPLPFSEVAPRLLGAHPATWPLAPQIELAPAD